MSKEKAIKKLQEMEKNRFKVSGKKFQGKTWFDPILSDENLETRINDFLLVNRDFFEKGSKVKEVVRCTINGKPAIEIKYTIPQYNDIYSVFFGEFCHYEPCTTGEFKPSYSFQEDEKGLYHLTKRINMRLCDLNENRMINGLEYMECVKQFNQSAINKINKRITKKKTRELLIDILRSCKNVK